MKYLPMYKGETMNRLIYYIIKNEMDKEDNEYATIVSKEDCYNEAYKIVKGEMLDLDLDRYWLEKNIPMYIK